MCRAINYCNKQRWQEQTFKVPLRFMFPLLHYPMKTAAKQPTSQWSSTFGKRSLRLQEKTHNAR
jgi:hypothetical protein